MSVKYNYFKVVPDAAFEDVKGNKFDLIVLPGGMPNAKTLAAVSFFM